ncbi:MAG: four helix bundle protein [Phycisphaerae bacterium]|nr:four helix bundle protein [Phycisphaerae bacterium]
MTPEELKARTKRFGLRIMKLVDALSKTTSGRAIGNQLVRSGTAVGVNYRAACRGRSKAEFEAKLGIVVEEADECGYWLELIMEGELLPPQQVAMRHQEASELAAIFTASIRTSKGRQPLVFNQQSAIENQK